MKKKNLQLKGVERKKGKEKAYAECLIWARSSSKALDTSFMR